MSTTTRKTDDDAKTPSGAAVPSKEAIATAREDQKWRDENPEGVRVREAKPGHGGESFDYLDAVSG